MTNRTGAFGAICRRGVLGLAAVFAIMAVPGCGPGDGSIGTDLPDAQPDVAYEQGAAQGTYPVPQDVQGQPAADAQAAPDTGQPQAPVVKASGSAQQAGDWTADESSFGSIIADTDGGTSSGPHAVDSGGTIAFGDIAGLPDGFHTGGAAALGLDAYSGDPAVEIHEGRPYFDIPEYPYETVIFSALDDYDRPGTAYACITADTGGRGTDFGWKDVPSGWQGTEYPGIVPGSSLYVKARLVDSALYDSRKDERNLISVTQYCRDNGLDPAVDLITAHLSEFGGYAAVRLTPVYLGTHLVCDGVLIEAASIGGTVDDTDDDPYNDSLSMCLFCYNVQPGVEIDYRNGLSSVSGEDGWMGADEHGNHDYILDESKAVFHEGACAAVAAMNYASRREYRGPRHTLIENRYEPCGICQP